MTLDQLQAQNAALSAMNDTQADTIKRQWMQISNVTKERDFWRAEAERQAERKPTPQEIAEAVCGGQE
jgi:hypothetical protein